MRSTHVAFREGLYVLREEDPDEGRAAKGQQTEEDVCSVGEMC